MTVSSKGSIGVGLISTTGDVELKADGAITDARGGRTVNIVADNVAMEAGSNIGVINGDELDIISQTVSALSSSNGISLRFPTGAHVSAPGIWAMGNANVYVMSDTGVISHGGEMSRAPTRLDGNFIGATGTGSVQAFVNRGSNATVNEGQIHWVAEFTKEKRAEENARNEQGQNTGSAVGQENQLLKKMRYDVTPQLLEFLNTDNAEKILAELFVLPESKPESGATVVNPIRQRQDIAGEVSDVRSMVRNVQPLVVQTDIVSGTNDQPDQFNNTNVSGLTALDGTELIGQESNNNLFGLANRPLEKLIDQALQNEGTGVPALNGELPLMDQMQEDPTLQKQSSLSDTPENVVQAAE